MNEICAIGHADANCAPYFNAILKYALRADALPPCYCNASIIQGNKHVCVCRSVMLICSIYCFYCIQLTRVVLNSFIFGIHGSFQFEHSRSYDVLVMKSFKHLLAR